MARSFKAEYVDMPDIRAKDALRQGYHVYCLDGGIICNSCAKKEYKWIFDWGAAVAVTYTEGAICAHCYRDFDV